MALKLRRYQLDAAVQRMAGFLNNFAVSWNALSFQERQCALRLFPRPSSLPNVQSACLRELPLSGIENLDTTIT
jgi:hypothetical protein